MNEHLYIGIMTGTSMDGIDATLVAFEEDGRYLQTIHSFSLPFPEALRQEFMALQQPGHDEIAREALAANELSHLCAHAARELLRESGHTRDKVKAIGMHGQTIRHSPGQDYTWQSANYALVSEQTNIDVIGDFRSRDIAAGGQGAPLVPACHAALFRIPDVERVIVNIGGIGNISILSQDTVLGFDTGPGNLLMDLWAARHIGKNYDHNGEWAATGTVHEGLLNAMLSDSFFADLPPKSTGRDLFHLRWLGQKMYGFSNISPVDVQATLLALTAASIANDIKLYAPKAAEVYVCGGGALNGALMQAISEQLAIGSMVSKVATTEALGVPPQQVEPLVFAWLAQCFVRRQPANLPMVTGARGPRILGALYPA